MRLPEGIARHIPDMRPASVEGAAKNKVITLSELPLYIAAARGIPDVNVTIIARPGSEFQDPRRTERGVVKANQRIVRITATAEKRKIFYRRIRRLREERLQAERQASVDSAIS